MLYFKVALLASALFVVLLPLGVVSGQNRTPVNDFDCSDKLEHSKDGEKFITGVFGFSRGNNGIGLNDDWIKEAFCGSDDSDNQGLNMAMAYRSWDRVVYPDFEYTEYVTAYMDSIYTSTQNSDCTAGMQILTPTINVSFTDSQINFPVHPDSLSGVDGILSDSTFTKFAAELLQKEFDLVDACASASDRHTEMEDILAETKDILTDRSKRPLGGWYLADEPITQNQDIGVINQIGKRIKAIEDSLYSRLFLESKGLNFDEYSSYHQSRFVAFHSQPLHGHVISRLRENENIGSIEKAKKYYKDGNNYDITKTARYSIFDEDVVDVIMPDYYNKGLNFWDVILDDIQYEYELNGKPLPEIMPVLQGFGRDGGYRSLNTDEYERIVNHLIRRDVDGIFFWAWNTTIYNCSLEDLWSSEDLYIGSSDCEGLNDVNVRQVVQNIGQFSLTTPTPPTPPINSLLMAYNNPSGSKDFLMAHSDGTWYLRDEDGTKIDSSNPPNNNPWFSWHSPSNGFYLNEPHFEHIVSGDFNGDGMSDVAFFYNQHDTAQRLIVMLSNGESFVGKYGNPIIDPRDGSTRWIDFNREMFDISNIVQVSSGDFNGDMLSDIAVLYLENDTYKIGTFYSDGSNFYNIEGNNIDNNNLPFNADLPEGDNQGNTNLIPHMTSYDIDLNGIDDLIFQHIESTVNYKRLNPDLPVDPIEPNISIKVLFSNQNGSFYTILPESGNDIYPREIVDDLFQESKSLISFGWSDNLTYFSVESIVAGKFSDNEVVDKNYALADIVLIASEISLDSPSRKTNFIVLQVDPELKVVDNDNQEINSFEDLEDASWFDTNMFVIAPLQFKFAVATDMDNNGYDDLTFLYSQNDNAQRIISYLSQKSDFVEKWYNNPVEAATCSGCRWLSVDRDTFDILEVKGFVEGSFKENVTITKTYMNDNRASVRNANFANSEVEPSFNTLAYPNPFNTNSTISFSLEKTSNIKVEVFNVLGQRVAILVDDSLLAGQHTYNFEAGNLSSGLYFYRLTSDNTSQVIKTTLVK